jgi:ferredoxin-NADP reductase
LIRDSSSTLEIRITEARSIARDVKLFVLEPADDVTLPAAQSGAHITMHLPNGMERQYSLLDEEAAPRRYRIAVKREAGGRGGSHYLHDAVSVGATLAITAPSNTFPLIESAPHTVLIAGGIGITPIWSMAKRLSSLGRPFELHYACRSREEAAFLAEISALPEARLHFDAEAGGRTPDIAAVCAAVPADAHLYCCGPAPMLAAFEAAAARWPASQRHVEHFTPKFARNVQGGFVVVLARSRREFIVPPGKTILETLRAGGVDVVSSCEEGVCGACETRVLEGRPEHRDSILSPEERAASRTMFICCSGAQTDKLVLDI